MESHVILAIVLSVAGLFLTIFGLWYKIDRDTNAKIDSLGKLFAEQLTEAQRQGDEKRARIYERLDTVKTAHRGEMDIFRKEVFDSFVSVKWCALIHENADKVYADFKKALETLNTKLDTLLGRG
jgi:5-methylcytosine-specific restriction endonuclease McrBC regulatory subunit McrC